LVRSRSLSLPDGKCSHANVRGVVPRVFHQIWVGPSPFPAEFAAFQETWRRHHPDWELRFWTDDNLPADLRNPACYERDRVPAERSDLIRLELLLRFGGIYVDTDFECLRPLDELLQDVSFFTASLKEGMRVNNAIFGSEPGHPLLEQAIRDARPQEKGGTFDKTASGSLFFDRLVKSFPEVTIFPAAWFYPTSPDERKTAYAVHYSARSWKDADEWRETALRAEERLEKEQRSHEKTKAKVAALEETVRALKMRVKKAERREPVVEFDEEVDVPGRRGVLSFLRRG
jgi:mannosyltransferase OCH1-like enzyme